MRYASRTTHLLSVILPFLELPEPNIQNSSQQQKSLEIIGIITAPHLIERLSTSSHFQQAKQALCFANHCAIICFVKLELRIQTLPWRFCSALIYLTTFSMTSHMELPHISPIDASPRSSTSWSRCDQAVARVAPIATTTCQICSKYIARGGWQLGLMFIHVEGFMLMEWIHLQCSKSLEGSGLTNIFQSVQSEMTPAQKQDFQLACQKIGKL